MFIFTAGPHTALIKSSGARRTSSQIVIGGRMFAFPIVERVDTLDLRLRTITIHTPRGTTKTGVIVDVVAVCQVKIQSWGLSDDHDIDHGAVRLAAQHFIGKNNAQIDEAISSTIAGHQRAIIGGLTVEELYRDRDRFAKNMRDHCENDMRGMGLSIVSYVVMEISDDQGYITALGVSQTEKVKRVAMEGAAVMKNAAISAANESKTRADMAVNTQRERKIQSDMQIRMKTADANREVAKAIAIQRKAKAITVAEQDKELLVKTQIAKEKEAEAEREVIGVRVEEERLTKLINITIPADAELYKNRIEAEIVKESTRANAERIRAVAEAEAEAIRQRGIAETRILHDRVKVWMNKYVFINLFPYLKYSSCNRSNLFHPFFVVIV